MKQHFCVSHAFFEGNVQTLDCEKLDLNRLKISQLHRYLLDVSELAVSTGSGRKRPHTLKCAIAYILWGNKIQYIMA